jgi:hemerythrin-like metal-binding protein
MNEDTLRFLPASLHIGVEEIDAQHADLFGHLVRLKRLCLNINRLPANEADALIARLRKHFSTEAHYAAEAGIDFTAHTIRHQTMLEQVTKALKGASAANADVFGVLRYVEYWFERHIANEDQELADKLLPHPNRPSFTETPPANG